MFLNFNSRIFSMGYPMPLYFFMSSDRTITPTQLKENLRRIVSRYIDAAVSENNKNTGDDHKDQETLRGDVEKVVSDAIKELLKEMLDKKIKVSTSEGDTTASKVFNLGSYVSDMNAELNQMIKDGIPL